MDRRSFLFGLGISAATGLVTANGVYTGMSFAGGSLCPATGAHMSATVTLTCGATIGMTAGGLSTDG